MKTQILCFLVLTLVTTYGGEKLKPTHLKPGKILFQSDFSTTTTLDKTHWQPRQGTRWAIGAGVLKGIPSSPEYQTKKKATGKGHIGNVPRIYLLNVPKDYILSYRFKLEGGRQSKAVPLVEFGHHITRVFFSPEGPRLLIDHEKKTLAKIGTPLQLGQWYNVLVEVQGDSVVVQIESIGTLQGKDPFIGKSDRPMVGFTGNVNGTLYLDDIRLVSIAK